MLSAAMSSSSGNSNGIALSSSSSLTFSSVSDTYTSIGSCSSTAGCSGEAKNKDLCVEEGGGNLRRGRKRRSRKGGRTSQWTVVGAAASSSDRARKRRAADSEKKRVRKLQEQYNQLSAVLVGDLVERGSRHSKVRTLGAAIRRLEDLQQLGSSVSQPPERISRWDTAFPEEVPCENAYSSPPPPNLKRLEPEQYLYPNTEEPSTSLDTLFPNEMTSGYPSIQEDVLPTYSATPYFSYSPAAEFPPMLGSFLFPGNSSGSTLPPPSSPNSSPKIVPHQMDVIVPTATRMGASPLPQLFYQCGCDSAWQH